MNPFSTFYSIGAVVAGQQPQKLRSTFCGNGGHLLEVDYNGSNQSFRVHFDDQHFLFFFEKDVFYKMLFKNEYGVALGKLQYHLIYHGWVQQDGKKYHFAIAGEDPQLQLFSPGSSAPLLSCDIIAELLMENLDVEHQNNLLYCLVFAFARIVEQAPI